MFLSLSTFMQYMIQKKKKIASEVYQVSGYHLKEKQEYFNASSPEIILACFI